MLILTRTVGQGFRIGDNVRVVVLETNGGQARIGVDAPREIAVQRDDAKSQTRKPSEVDRLRQKLEKAETLLAQERRRKERAVKRYAQLANLVKEKGKRNENVE